MSKLIVNQIQASGGVALTLPNADGANGAFLVTNGSAQLDFQTIDIATNANVSAAVGVETTNRTAADALKADQATTYTKTEVDANIAAIPDTDLSPYDTSVQVDTKIAGIVDSAPGTLDTLNELAAALGDDPNHVTTMTTLVGTKADQSTTYTKTEVDTAVGTKIDTANPTFTGTLDGAGNTYTNLHPEVETTASATGTHAIDFNTPYHNVNISGATTFSFQNSGVGKICIIQLAALAGQTPSFPSTVKWADDTEPTWGDYGMWVISLTGVNASWMVGSAVGITV